MQTPAEFRALVATGLAAIREQFDVPGAFPPEVQAAAEQAARRSFADRPDRTDIPLVTLDPAGAIDLDQAFAIERDGPALVLRYAIADVSAFVEPGDALDHEAWRRGVTVYLPDEKASLYPRAVSEAAASLLPDGERPAVLLSVAVDPEGRATLRSAERARVRSRAKLAYESARPGELSPLLAELAARVTAAEDGRGAARVEFPEQEVDPDPARPGGYVLAFRARRATEDQNATMSLAANLAVAQVLLAARTGLFRVMPGPDERDVRVLRQVAAGLGLDWPAHRPLAEFERALPPGARSAAFLLAVRRSGGGADYQAFDPTTPPFHAAIAAPYAHATAPLRRLADRYVLDATCALAAGDPVPDHVTAAFAELPAAMDRAEARAAKVDRAVVDLVEAAVLAGRDGDRFEAWVIDTDERGARIQLAEPAVIARLDGAGGEVMPGDRLMVRLTVADPTERRLAFEAVSRAG